MKAKKSSEATLLEHIPNIGKAMSRDLNVLGITKPSQLIGKDPIALYRKLERATGVSHDPCVCDTLMAAVDFMEGGKSRPWWDFTAKRKKMLSGD